MESYRPSLELWFCRHGQANTAGGDYDQLSPLGFEQARQTGEFFRDGGMNFDAIWCGSLRRQQETARTIREALVNFGEEPTVAAAPVRENSDWNEFPVRVWLERAGRLRREDRDFANIYEQWKQVQQGQLPGDKGHVFHAMLVRIIASWMRSDPPIEGEFSFFEFRDQVRRAIASVTGEPAGDPVAPAAESLRVLVVTSGTPLAILLAEALEVEEPTRLLSGLRHIYNCGLHRYEWRAGQMELVSFNCADHLPLSDRTRI